MSDTPRTDAVVIEGADVQYVTAHFARSLERELAEANELLDRFEKAWFEACVAAYDRNCMRGEVPKQDDKYPALTARIQALEEAARIVERHMGPIEIFNAGYRKWLMCAAEIRALVSQPPDPKPPHRAGRETA